MTARVNERELNRLFRAGLWALDMKMRADEYAEFLGSLISKRERRGDLAQAKRLRDYRERFVKVERTIN